MKKFINQIDTIVDEMLEGIVASNPELVRVKDFHIIKRKHIEEKVTLVSGGGSGHEPAHAGFVRKGMLDAAVAGEVFTSPTPDQVLKAIQEVNQNKGVLLIIKNYSGDLMNFEMAKELAEMEGIDVRVVVVGDDVAVENSTYTVGKRGIAGTLYVHKIAGLASLTMSLDEVHRIAQKVANNIVSIGISLKSCTVPAAGKPNFVLAEDEVEIGLGIHGEPGVRKEKLKPVKEHVSEMINMLLNTISLKSEDEVAVLINGLGGTPLMELYLANNNVMQELKNRQIHVYRSDVGTFMSSLDMEGFSITLLKLDDELKQLLTNENSMTLF